MFLEWSEEDRAWALALMEEKADECPGCGHPRSETTKAEAEFTYTAEVVRCHACTPLFAKQREMVDEKPGLLFGVRQRQ